MILYKVCIILAAPVSFSIKKLKEPDPILPKPALPYESSSDDESENHADRQEKQDKPEELKLNTPLLYPPQNIPPVVVYKMEASINNLPMITTIEPMKLIPKPVLNHIKVPEISREEPKPIVTIEKPVPKVEEVKKSPSPDRKVEKRESPKKEKRLEKKRQRSKSREKRSKSKDRRSKSRERRSKSKDRGSKTRDVRSISKDRRRSIEREKKRERDSEKIKKTVKFNKDELESEIISLEDNSDDMIDLTGELSDSKGEFSVPMYNIIYSVVFFKLRQYWETDTIGETGKLS